MQYTNAFYQNNRNQSITHEALQGMSSSERQAFFHKLYSDAANGVGFFYGRHKVSPEKQHEDKMISNVFNWLNSEETLETVKSISGFNDITNASAQVTQYLPGHFLTRHNDISESEQRRVAYVISLSKDWHPDWGGLLQFYLDNGTPRDAWAPQFNSMALFDVDHVHAVTYVAPYATQARYSITGWFKAN